MGNSQSQSATTPSILGPEIGALQASAPVRDPFDATVAVRPVPSSAIPSGMKSGIKSGMKRPGLQAEAAKPSSAIPSGMKSGMKKSGMKRPGLQAEATKPLDRGTRTTRVQIGVAGATPKKLLVLPGLDQVSGPCGTFVAFTPTTARVPGPHAWDQARVRALLGTGEVAQHMKEFTGYAELLFVACAQCSGAPLDLQGRQPINDKRSRREPPLVKMLVALATTGRFWLLRGGLHVAPTNTTCTASGCCAGPQMRYSRSASAWEQARESYHVDGAYFTLFGRFFCPFSPNTGCFGLKSAATST